MKEASLPPKTTKTAGKHGPGGTAEGKTMSVLSCVITLLACVAAAALAHSALRFHRAFRRGMAYMHEQEATARPVGNLTLNGRRLAWYVLDDVVMGGHSSSTVSAAAGGGLVFSGTISTKDGGFCSCSTREQPLELPQSTAGFRVALTGDGSLYTLTVRTSASVWEPVWQADLPSRSLDAGVRHELIVPLSDFRASRMGRPVHGHALDPSDIQAVGLNLALLTAGGGANLHFGDGPFAVTLHSIEAADASPFAAATLDSIEASKMGAKPPAADSFRSGRSMGRLFTGLHFSSAAAVPSQAPSLTKAAAAAEAATPPSTAAWMAAPHSHGAPQPRASLVVPLATFDGTPTARSWRVTNDPVMGGRSSSHFTTNDGAGRFTGTCAIVPFLRAPGFCKATAVGAFADASAHAGGALLLSLRTRTPGYAGFKVAFSAERMPSARGAFRHGSPSFKADFRAPAAAAGAWATVRVPFSSFSVDWSEFTGSCATRDPDGTQHVCCSAEHPEVCPRGEHLASLRSISVWAEGAEGDFDLELHSIAAGP